MSGNVTYIHTIPFDSFHRTYDVSDKTVCVTDASPRRTHRIVGALMALAFAGGLIAGAI